MTVYPSRTAPPPDALSNGLGDPLTEPTDYPEVTAPVDGFARRNCWRRITCGDHAHSAVLARIRTGQLRALGVAVVYAAVKDAVIVSESGNDSKDGCAKALRSTR